MSSIYRILDRKRHGLTLAEDEVRAAVRGATDGSWSDAQLAAFLMAVAIHGLDADETRALTLAMLESGEQWRLADEVPHLADKHSTGGVGDTVSLILTPILAECGVPVVMLTGRALGHSGGTADKLETIPGLDLSFDRRRCLELLDEHRMAIGIATSEVAPADRRLYAIRDRTATVSSLPLMAGSIVSKKLATGAAALVYDVKTGNGAFLPERADAERLARLLVDTSRALGCAASALVTDMSQPLGQWVGHTAEVLATYEALEGRGAPDLMAVTLALAQEVATLAGTPVSRAALERSISSGGARERFARWAVAQGADAGWTVRPELSLAPVERVLEAPRGGRLLRVDTRGLGLALGAACRGDDGSIDAGIALRLRVRLGDEVAAGDELARLYLRCDDAQTVAAVAECFEVGEPEEGGRGGAPELICGRIGGGREPADERGDR